MDAISIKQGAHSALLLHLAQIQSELKAPKGQYNKFGGFKYRSCEDILEAVKPLLKELGLVLLITDDIVQIGERYYVRATATIYDSEGSYISNSALAREDANKGKMDGSQMTGSASSYARKYALNGLFAIDDTKDADTDEYTKAQEGKKSTAKATAQPAFTDEIKGTLAKAQTVQELVETFGRLPQALRDSAEVKSYCAQLKSNLETPQPATKK
ncbi:ERF family protein [Porphyromonas vaginalis]|uniref:ERF family protein n=1 Tax=Porphyromonas vaginalis TaxID=3044325 RepID=UPI0026359FD0|nr:ERF family protein [Porphyromonas vaginalis]